MSGWACAERPRQRNTRECTDWTKRLEHGSASCSVASWAPLALGLDLDSRDEKTWALS